MTLQHKNISKPRLSIIIPALNASATIKETLQSVCEIPIAEMEIIVSDNVSDDNTLEILEKFNDQRINIVRQVARLSAADHWTAVSRLASGEYVKLVCADDLVYPKVVLRQLEIAKNNLDCPLILNSRDVITPRDIKIFSGRGGGGFVGKVSGDAAIRKSISEGMNIFGEPVCALFQTKSFLENLPWSTKFSYVIDLEFYTRIAKSNLIYFDHEPVGAFRISRSSWSAKIGRHQSSDFIEWINHLLFSKKIQLSKNEMNIIKLKLLFNQVLRNLIVTLACSLESSFLFKRKKSYK